jgi:hypothetical protein
MQRYLGSNGMWQGVGIAQPQLNDIDSTIASRFSEYNPHEGMARRTYEHTCHRKWQKLQAKLGDIIAQNGLSSDTECTTYIPESPCLDVNDLYAMDETTPAVNVCDVVEECCPPVVESVGPVDETLGVPPVKKPRFNFASIVLQARNKMARDHFLQSQINSPPMETTIETKEC